MAGEFRRANVLAGPSEGIDDHKVVRDLSISEEEGLRADFAVKNGAVHATATLDLRKSTVHISYATLPALILDKAAKIFGEETKRLGVYAVPHSTLSQFRPHLRILADYADEIYNWLDPDDRRNYTRRIFTAINSPRDYTLI